MDTTILKKMTILFFMKILVKILFLNILCIQLIVKYFIYQYQLEFLNVIFIFIVLFIFISINRGRII
jgi:hypothetical protein